MKWLSAATIVVGVVYSTHTHTHARAHTRIGLTSIPFTYSARIIHVRMILRRIGIHRIDNGTYTEVVLGFHNKYDSKICVCVRARAGTTDISTLFRFSSLPINRQFDVGICYISLFLFFLCAAHSISPIRDSRVCVHSGVQRIVR